MAIVGCDVAQGESCRQRWRLNYQLVILGSCVAGRPVASPGDTGGPDGSPHQDCSAISWRVLHQIRTNEIRRLLLQTKTIKSQLKRRGKLTKY